jgi:hypothetical protein
VRELGVGEFSKISLTCFVLAWFDFPLFIGVWAEWDRLGVFGREGEEGGVRSGPGAARTILLFHIISHQRLVPLNSLVWWEVPLGYLALS